MKTFFASLNRLLPVILAGFTFLNFAMAADEKTAVKKYEGTLKTGIMAIGGETTGVILVTKNEGTYEIDLGGNKKLLETAGKLNGKPVVVEGEYKPRAGIEIPERRIVVVTSLEAAR
ncbi:MAG: hypothetical protein WCN98_20795 [Verrucomicrobiaceae bacterium]